MILKKKWHFSTAELQKHFEEEKRGAEEQIKAQTVRLLPKGPLSGQSA
jgi:hypothetical protein